MKNFRPVFLCAHLMWVSSVASAVTVESSTGVYLTYRDCMAGETACDELSATIIEVIDGLPGNRKAEKVHEEPSRGKTSGEVKLTDSPMGSEHSTVATSLAGSRNGSNTMVIQKYSNSSGVTETLTVSGVLQFDQRVPEENADLPAGRSSASAELVIVSLNVDRIEAGTTAEDNLQTLLDGPQGVEFTELASATTGQEPGTSESGSKSITATVNVGAGESVWIFTITQALAANGAEVSADLELQFAAATAE